MLRRLLSPAALPGRRGLFVLAAAVVACAALAGFAAPAQAQTAPAFVAGLPSEQSVAENTAPGTAIGSPYTATDADADDTLIWSLEGPDAASFAIDTSTGQLKTKAQLDFETKSSYVVTVKVSDGAASAKIVVRITVTAMNARTVPGPVTSLRANIMGFSLEQRPIRIHWDAPASNGGTPITGYEVLSFFVPALAEASWRPVPATQTSYSDYALSLTLPHGVYDTAVRAINAVGKGPIAWLRVRYTGDTPTKPGPPSGLTATPGLDSVTLSWDPPRIAGTADISHYDYRYQLGSAPVSGEWINIGDGAARTYTVTGLTGGQEYFFQVRAQNSNGNGTYAQVAATPQAAVTTPGNNAPAFVAGLPSEQSVAENTPAGTAIGSPYTATDDDGDTLTWSLEGPDAASFAIDTSSGQLRTKAPLDHETKPRYVVTVRVSDGTDSDTIVVRIAVTAVTVRTVPGPVADFEVEIASHSGGANAGRINMRWNPPKSDGGSDIISYEIKMGLHGSRSTTLATKSGSDRSHSAHNLIEGTWEVEIRARNAVGYGSPSVVRVRIASASPIRPGPPSGLTPTPGPGSVTLSWDPPSTTGTSAISHYDYRYQLGSAPASGEWINIGDGAARTHTVTGLTGGEEHFFQVRARNGNGNGTYAQVAATPQVVVATSGNNAPEFSAAALAATTQSVVEYTAAGTAIGSPYTATDDDGDTLTWSLGGGTDAASFAIDTSTGQLRTKAALDYETKSSYVVAVRVSDGTDSATIVVTIAVTAVTVRTVPGPVRDFEVEIVSHSEGRNAGRIDLSWVPPRSDGGREITFYEIKINLLGSSTTISATKSGSDRSHSADDLTEGTWEVEIRARNAVGLGSPIVARVRITSASPIRPGPPSGLTPTPGPGSVKLSWDPPGTTGTADISHYDYRFQLGRAPASGAWINIGDGTVSTHTVTGLAGGQEYFFQVRARNGNGNGTYAQVAATPQAAVATPGNNAPEFSAAALAATTQSVAENTAADMAIGSPYTATDTDGDTLTWSLGGGTDAASFAIDTSTGQLRTKAALDYETKSRYVVTVRVSDGTDSATIVVRIAVTATAGRTVPGPVTDLEVEIVSHSGGGNAGRIDMSWDPPGSDGGSEITFYEIKIDRLGSSITSSARKTGSEHSHSELNLTEGIWEVEIRARNAVGLGSPIVARVRITSASPIRPGPPSGLTPTPGPGSVTLSWDPPSTTGTADISHYDYRYQLGSAPVSGEWINIGDGAARTYTVAGLTGGQEYFFQVRARNSNGNGTYAMVSATPRAAAFTNAAPVFSVAALAATAQSVAENTAADTAIGSPYTATDADADDTLTYTLEGTDAASFAIDTSDGQLRTGAPLDHETKPSHAVTVKVSDGTDSATIDVTVTVTDAEEPPDAPDAPTVAATSGSATSLDVSWTAPDNTGPAVADYDYRYRVKTPRGSWTEVIDTAITVTSATITGLTASTTYQVQVRAENAEGASAWSESGEGTVNAPLNVAACVGGALWSATMTVGDESSGFYKGYGGFTEGGSLSTNTFSYGETDYVVQELWFRKGLEGSGIVPGYTLVLSVALPSDQLPGFTLHVGGNAALGLAGADSRDNGKGFAWSDNSHGDSFPYQRGNTVSVCLTKGAVSTNAAPSFTSSATASVEENTTSVLIVAADDGDTDDTVTGYAFAGGADDSKFTLDGTSGALTFKVAPDFENPTDAASTNPQNGVGNNEYIVKVRATSGTGTRVLTADQTITVTVTDANEPPEAPAAPTFGTATASTLVVNWETPTNDGRPPIASYDVQYRVKTPPGSWTEGPQDITGNTATITGLAASTAYEVQVRATNDEGTGGWSSSGDGTTSAAANSPATGTVTISDTTPHYGEALTVTVSDVVDGDGVPATPVYSYQWVRVDGSDETEISGTTTSSYTPVAADVGKKLKMRVQFTDNASNTETLTSGNTQAVTQDVSVTMSVDPATIDEGAATLTTTLTVKAVTEAAAAPSSNVAFFVGNSGLTATLHDDYLGFTQGNEGVSPVLRATHAAPNFQPSDFAASSGGTTWEAEKTYTLTVVNDVVDEDASETFQIHANASPSTVSWVTLPDAVTVTITDDDEVPGAPTNLAATPGDAKVTLSWGAPTDAGTSSVTSYDYRQSTDGGSTWGSWTDAGDVLEKEIAGLTNGTEYTFEVRAVSAAGDGAPSAEMTGTPKAAVPDQVTNVVVTAGVEQLAVSWDAVSGASGYTVQWKSGAQAFDATRQHVVTGGTATSYTIPGLAAGTEYTVRVIATKANADDGAPSSEMTGTPKAAAPDQVTNVRVTAEVNQLAVSWDAVSAVDGYTVQWKSESQEYDATRQHVVTGGTATSYTIPGLTAGTAYTVRVIATKAHADDGPPSAEMTGTPKAAVPDQVTNVVVTAGVSQLAVSWEAVSGADGYTVQWKSGSQDYDASRQHMVADGATTSYTIPGLTPGTEYTVRVIATRANAADGAPSAAMTGTPVAANAAPSFTSSATADVVENTTTVLTVAATDGDGEDSITGYTLTGGADRSKFEIDGSSGALTFADAPDYENPTDAVPDNSYVVIVRATSGTGDREMTAEQTITATVTDDDTEAPGAPGAPTLPSETASSLTVNWSAPTNTGPAIADYDVRWRVKTPPGSWTEAEDTTDSTAMTATITGLAASTAYEVQVRATNDEGTGGWSSSGDGTTSAAANSPATGTVTISDTTPHYGEALTVTVSDVVDGDGVPATPVYSYQWVRVDGSDETEISGTTTSSYTPVAADVGKKLKMRVQFTDNASNTETLTSGNTQAVTQDVSVTMSVDPATIDEGAATLTTTLTVKAVTEAAAAPSSNVAFFVGNSGLTATLHDDYLGFTQGNEGVSPVLRATHAAPNFQPSDFAASSGGTTWEAEKTYTLTVVNDVVDEDASETFQIHANASPSTVSWVTLPDAVTVTITDDDAPPGLSIADQMGSESTSSLSFTVTLDAPSSKQVTVAYVTSDGTATAGSDYVASLSGATLTIPAGATVGTITVPVTQDALDEDDETFKVTLSGAANATLVDGEATGTIEDDDTPPELSVADQTGAEGVGDMTFTVTLSAVSGRDVTVGYATSDGTATAGSDYVASLSGATLTIPAGTTAGTITVPVTQDALDEDDETFTVTLSGAANATLVDSEATGTIDDDDAPPELSIADQMGAEGVGDMRFTVALSAVSGRDVTVGYATSDGTAIAGSDYTASAANATLVIAAGATTGLITVPVTQDGLDEADTETFKVTLSNPVNAALVDGEATGTIEDDDETLMIIDLADGSVAENTAYTSMPAVTGASSAVTWTVEGTDAGDFTIHADTGALGMVGRDFENPVDADEDNDYEVTVRATDAYTNTATQALTVTVTDVVETSTLTISGLADGTVAENAVYTSATPTVTGALGAVTWTREGTDAGDFTINGTTGVLGMVGRDFESPADADEDNDYEVTVKVEDADGNTATQALTVTVTDVVETSTLTISGLADGTVAENAVYTSATPTVTGALGAVTWTREGTDADDFTINGTTGVLGMVGRDFESPADADEDNDYEVTVKVGTATRRSR